MVKKAQALNKVNSLQSSAINQIPISLKTPSSRKRSTPCNKTQVAIAPQDVAFLNKPWWGFDSSYQILENSPKWVIGKPNPFWANFNVSKPRNVGHKLESIQPQIQNEVKYTKIIIEDVESDIKFWELAMVSYVLWASSPFSVPVGFIHRIWVDYTTVKIIMIKKMA